MQPTYDQRVKRKREWKKEKIRTAQNDELIIKMIIIIIIIIMIIIVVHTAIINGHEQEYVYRT